MEVPLDLILVCHSKRAHFIRLAAYPAALARGLARPNTLVHASRRWLRIYNKWDGSICVLIIIQGAQNFLGIGIGNHGRPWACEREGPVLKKMLWEVGVYSRLSERLIKDGRDSAKRVVSDTDTPKVLLEKEHR